MYQMASTKLLFLKRYKFLFHHSLKSLGARNSPIVPRILSPKKGTGRTLGNSQQSKHAQPSNDVARSLFKDGIQKLEVNTAIKDSQPATTTPIAVSYTHLTLPTICSV